MSSDTAILVINCGSSSRKFALFASAATSSRHYSDAVERIGIGQGRFHIEASQARSPLSSCWAAIGIVAVVVTWKALRLT